MSFKVGLWLHTCGGVSLKSHTAQQLSPDPLTANPQMHKALHSLILQSQSRQRHQLSERGPETYISVASRNVTFRCKPKTLIFCKLYKLHPQQWPRPRHSCRCLRLRSPGAPVPHALDRLKASSLGLRTAVQDSRARVFWLRA